VNDRTAPHRDGRRAADDRMRALFSANADDLLNYLARRVSPVEDAADLLSDTLLAACRNARTLPADPERARMWLFVTARNTLRNHDRGHRRRHELAHKLADTLRVHATAEADDRADDVRDAVAALSPVERELVRLIYWDGFPIVEAAELLEIPASTARGRLQSIRSQLRIALAEPTPTALDPA
jgi:RNA polymerase sigma factor (sigma-70 family)